MSLFLIAAASAEAQTALSADEAAKLAFGSCTPRKDNVFLTDAQLKEIKSRSGYEMSSRLVPRYLAKCGGADDGAAYVDIHTVRTKTETLMIVIDREMKIRRIEVLSFNEPPEYKPKEKWYGLFTGKSLSDELNLKRGISPVAGSTLTARATASAARRILALHQILSETPKKSTFP
ncbi:MAG TPA: hypothetical protein VFV50_19550 [Bdellovibrionales bacterium]|nr:hypothetical protein [Bdellovibrionales bacterium]